MSTTVTYKGQTLTTVENQTKTLQTAGTWVEGDFTLTDASLDVSDTTATASDVAQGKVFYSNTGTRTTGTASGGGDEMYKLAAGTITDADIDWSKLTSIRQCAFETCRELTTVGNPTVRTIAERAFQYCSNLTSIEITCTDLLQTYCGSAFRYCTNLLTATIHFSNRQSGNVSFGANYAFANNTKLQTVIFDYQHATKQLDIRANWMCYGSSALRNLVLKSPNMAILTNGAGSTAWGGIYDNPTESKIYVPQALISTYQTATNWSTLYNAGVQFVAIEGSEYDD